MDAFVANDAKQQQNGLNNSADCRPLFQNVYVEYMVGVLGVQLRLKVENDRRLHELFMDVKHWLFVPNGNKSWLNCVL